MIIYLLDRVPMCGGVLVSVHLRLPDEGSVARLAAITGPHARLPLSAVPHIAARLSGLTAAALARLTPRDMARLGNALERLHAQATRSIGSKADRRQIWGRR